ncbi:MAG: helix-turn-helix domain-containing protein [Bacteroidota bacterium]|nr:helix-turn-helix domain-containing protein [Bacteroidota bacterium]
MNRTGKEFCNISMCATMPEVKFYTPEVSLQWIVKQFETIKHKDQNKLLTDKFIPRPDAALVFHFKDIPQVVAPVHASLHPFFIAPVVSIPNQLQIEGELDGFIIICKASVLSNIFKLKMCPESNSTIKLPAKTFGPLWKNLCELTSDMERINCFSRFIQSYTPHGYKTDPVDIIYNQIVDNISEFTLQDINENYFQSLSSLQRNFQHRVGVSMKRLMRISRVSHLFRNMLKDQRFNAQKMMFEGNYYDQSHFIKDFKELTGDTPKQFFQYNTELCRILSGMFKEDFISS